MIIRPDRRRPASQAARLVLVAAFSLTVASCGSDGSPTPPPDAAAGPASSIPANGEARPIAPGEQATPQPLPERATARGDQPGTEVTVHELRRTGKDSVRLTFTVSNHDAGDWTYLTDFAEPAFVVGGIVSDVGGTYLVDQAANLKYLVLRDTEDQCVCSETIPTALDEGEQFTAFAEFPAPPESVTSVTVVVPHFNPMQAVPISA